MCDVQRLLPLRCGPLPQVRLRFLPQHISTEGAHLCLVILRLRRPAASVGQLGLLCLLALVGPLLRWRRRWRIAKAAAGNAQVANTEQLISFSCCGVPAVGCMIT